MRAATATQRVGIASALAKGSCPVCSVMKAFQTQILEGRGVEEPSLLCNFHAWGLAKSAPAEIVAGAYLRALRGGSPPPNSASGVGCDICRQMHKEEEIRLAELERELNRPTLKEWMRQQGCLCLRHAEGLLERPGPHQALIREIVTRNAAELEQELAAFYANVRQGKHSGGGVLGRAAEFLVSQRGILV